ncbi:hypothetical protein B9Z55_021175 [Caenorhabditis nigoni]|uniref:Lin-15A/B-like domain-containing protein n=1 Tax=Caenorhabditis nigoni TaxID=1611254 RepID=A0A2G5TRD8_9PELO|nr:hypothetical protein B9Z55_021175 [Caenorhabditis nigoni]
MDEAIVKDEVIEETINFTFKNGEYVEVKQEKIEQIPENLLEQEIKTEPIDFSGTFEPKTKKIVCKIEKVAEEIPEMKCEFCQKMMPRNLLKLIKPKDEQTVLSEMLSVELFREIYPEMNPKYVCFSDIQTFFNEKYGQLKSTSTQSERNSQDLMQVDKRSIILKYNNFRNSRKTWSRTCQVCQKMKNLSEFYYISSKRIRIVLMIGCILRGTHSIDQAKSYITTNNKGKACYSDCKESINKIFEHLGVKSIQKLSKCYTQAMDNLMDIAKNFDPNFTVDQFILAFNLLYLKNKKRERSFL